MIRFLIIIFLFVVSCAYFKLNVTYRCSPVIVRLNIQNRCSHVIVRLSKYLQYIFIQHD